jgi:hypothetical protein
MTGSLIEIEKAGKILERNKLEPINKICMRLSRNFKGIIAHIMFRNVARK